MSEKLTKINWEEVAAAELIPEGKYHARLDKVEARKGREEPHNPYWNFEFTLIAPEQVEGRKVWDVFMLDPKSLWKLRNFCECIGIELEGQRDLDTAELEQQEVGVHLVHDTYQNKQRVRVKGYFAIGT